MGIRLASIERELTALEQLAHETGLRGDALRLEFAKRTFNDTGTDKAVTTVPEDTEEHW